MAGQQRARLGASPVQIRTQGVESCNHQTQPLKLWIKEQAIPELLPACRQDHGGDQGGNAVMEAYQWFLLGMMVAWTPGLLVLALMLRRRKIGHDPHISHDGPQRADRRRHSPARAMDLVQIDRRTTARRALKS